MNRLWIVLLAVVAAFSLLHAEGVEWRSMKAGMQEAKATGKIIMIDVVRTGCHYCDDMEREVFEDQEMAMYLQQRFIPVKINLAEEALPWGLEVSMTPTFFFVTKEGDVLKKVPGSWNRQDFRSFLEGIKR